MDAVDRQFTRWRDTGDLDALAAVYDAAAPALLRLALHHVRQPASAEDLVQTTFLAAIHNARAYDATRPLLGWLVGILANQARWMQRREGRAIDAERLHGAAPADPLAAATAAEFTAQCDAAIEALPEAYRPVLRLHLKHELLAAEIAHVLGRPPGTVRSQIARGLELLRSALPTGVTLAAFAALLPARGLEVVRREVLAAANSIASASVAALGVSLGVGLLGSIVMKKLVVVVAAVAALVLWVASRQPAAGAAATVPSQPALPVAASGADAKDGRNSPQPAVAGSVRQDGALAVLPSKWSLALRVLRAPGVVAGLPALAAVGQLGDGTCELPVVEVGDDGRCRVDLEGIRTLAPTDLAQVRVVVDVDAPGHVGVEEEAELPHRDPARDLQLEMTVQLVAGATVSGRVVDREGHPVPKAEITLQREDGEEVALGHSRSDGRFRLAAPESGGGSIVASLVSLGRARQSFHYQLGEDRDVGDLVLRSLHQMVVRVEFPGGQPAPGVEVLVAPEGEDGSRLLPVVTDAAGSVRIATDSAEPRSLEIEAVGPDLPLTAVPDGAPTVIVLENHRLLRFSCRDDEGRLLRALAGEFAAWPASVASEFGSLALGASTPAKPHWHGVMYLSSLLVPVGAFLHVSAEHGDMRAEVLLQAAAAPNIQEVLVPLVRWQRSAELRLRLKAADGLEVGALAAQLEPLRLGDAEAYRLPLVPADGALTASYYPGRYRLRLRSDYGGVAFGWFNPIEREIDLVAGQATEVSADVVVGGRLRFVFHLPQGATGPIQRFRITSPAAHLGWPVDPRMLIQGGSMHRTSDIPPDEPLLWRPLLPPGRHEVRIEAEGYAEAVVGVDVRARTITDVHVHLQPR